MLRRSLQGSRYGILLLLPSIILVAVFVYGFIGYTVGIAFTDWGEQAALARNPELHWNGLDNFIHLFTSPLAQRFRQDLMNTLWYSFSIIGGAMVVGIFLAILMDRKIAGGNGVRTVFLYPMALSFIVTGTIWRWMFIPSGGINVLPSLLFGLRPLSFEWLSSRESVVNLDWHAMPRILLCIFFVITVLLGVRSLAMKKNRRAVVLFAMGLAGMVGGLLYRPTIFQNLFVTRDPELHGINLAISGIILAAIWQYSGYTMALYVAAFGNVDSAIRDAAKIDGLNELQYYMKIALKVVQPVTLSAIIVLAHISLKLFALIFSMAGPDNAETSSLSLYMFLQTFRANRFAEGAAIATILFLIAAVFIVPYLISQSRTQRER